MIDLDELERIGKAATQGQWHYDSYSRIYAADFIQADVKSLDEYEAATVPKDEMFWREKIYAAESLVASVPSIAGDTATGRHARDAVFISAARNNWQAMIDEIRKLEKFRWFVSHDEECPAHGDAERDCTCGLRELMSVAPIVFHLDFPPPTTDIPEMVEP